MTICKGADEPGRAGCYERQQVRPAAQGHTAFLSDKYDVTQHPNYKYTSDYDKKYTFDIEKYLNRRMKLKADDEYDVIEA